MKQNDKIPYWKLLIVFFSAVVLEANSIAGFRFLIKQSVNAAITKPVAISRRQIAQIILSRSLEVVLKGNKLLLILLKIVRFLFSLCLVQWVKMCVEQSHPYFCFIFCKQMLSILIYHLHFQGHIYTVCFFLCYLIYQNKMLR